MHSTDVQAGEVVAMLFDNPVQFAPDGRPDHLLVARRGALQGSILFLSLVFVMVNLVTDLLYAKVEPRVAYD